MITQATEVDPLQRIFLLMREFVPDYKQRFDLNQAITAYGLEQYRNGMAEGAEIKKKTELKYKKAS